MTNTQTPAPSERLQVNVDFTQYPELFTALETLESELDTDKSKLIRNLVREKAIEHGHLKAIKARVIKPKIQQIRQASTR
jgi:hypothetical protein